MSSFALLAAGAGSILLSAWAAVRLVRSARRAVAPAVGLRAAALLAVLATGGLLGAAGIWLTGDAYALLAIPGALAAGWLFLADPSACRPGRPISPPPPAAAPAHPPAPAAASSGPRAPPPASADP